MRIKKKKVDVFTFWAELTNGNATLSWNLDHIGIWTACYKMMGQQSCAYVNYWCEAQTCYRTAFTVSSNIPHTTVTNK